MKKIGVLILLAMVGCGDATSRNHVNGDDFVSEKADGAQGDEAVQIVLRVVSNNPALYPEVSLEKLKSLASVVKIEFKDAILENGKELDSTSDGAAKITLSRSRWRAQSPDEFKEAIVFHELLRLLKVEDKTKYISKRILSVENRYLENTEYSCTGDKISTPCQMRMIYDPTRRAMEVRDLSCSYFPSELLSTYFGANQLYKYCDTGSSGLPSANCSRPSDRWVFLSLGDNISLTFDGYGKLNCQPSTHQPEQ